MTKQLRPERAADTECLRNDIEMFYRIIEKNWRTILRRAIESVAILQRILKDSRFQRRQLVHLFIVRFHSERYRDLWFLKRRNTSQQFLLENYYDDVFVIKIFQCYSRHVLYANSMCVRVPNNTCIRTRAQYTFINTYTRARALVFLVSSRSVPGNGWRATKGPVCVRKNGHTACCGGVSIQVVTVNSGQP